MADYAENGAFSSGSRPVPRGQRREANKARRIEALLTAAAELVLERSGTEFTMHHLSERAGFSLATTYNLIGTKAAVLYRLLDSSLDTLATAQAQVESPHEIERIKAMVDLAVDFFTAKPDYYRPLMRYLLGLCCKNREA